MNLCCGLLACSRKNQGDENNNPTPNDAMLRRTSFFSAKSCEEHPGAGYRIRGRIPTRVDLSRHPSSEWWSDARVDAPHVVEDLGQEPRVLARTVEVHVLSRDCKCGNEIDYFKSENFSMSSRRYMILQLLLGDKILVSLGEILDTEYFDSLFASPGGTRSCFPELCTKFKLIVNPANVRIPWEIQGPKNSSSIAEFFGEQNCSVKRKSFNSTIHFAVVTIDVYSRFMIRSFLPKLAFQPGRISDYILVDYEGRTILTGFRIVATSVLSALLAKPKRYSFTSLSYF